MRNMGGAALIQNSDGAEKAYHRTSYFSATGFFYTNGYALQFLVED